MKQAFIILSHKSPNQLRRLISIMDSPFFDFFIHIDLRVEIAPFVDLIKTEHSKVHFVKKRTKADWGGFGLVQGTINSIEEVISSTNSYSHISLISGQDYPIKSNQFIHDFFEENLSKNFIAFEPFPVKSLNFGGFERIQHRSVNLKGRRHTYLPKKYLNNSSFKGKMLNSLLWIYEKITPKRVIPYNMKPYYGSQWWSLTYESIKSIMEFLLDNPKFIKYHKESLIPDEMFFQMILLNNEIIDTIINDNKRFILWNKESSHPISLSSSRLPEINMSDKLFARKFEET